MVEKSPLGLVEVVLHLICGTVCIGVVIASAVALSAIADSFLFDDDIVEENDHLEDDLERFRGVLGWLLFASIAGIFSRIAMAVIRGVFYLELVQSQYLYYLFAVLNNLTTILLSLSLISGGSTSTANAVNVQQDYIDVLDCDQAVSALRIDECGHLEQLRDAQAGAAACAFLAAVICVVITVIVMVDVLNLTKRKEEPTTNYK